MDRHHSAASDFDWLQSSGEMVERIRAFEWSKTSIGPASSWSPALRMSVRFLVANRFPHILWWGADYVQFYNDPYRPIPGSKHPAALGQPARECWAEIWDVIGPLIDTPFLGGPATWDDDIFLEINRHGFTEETHFTIAYSPVPDDTVPGGIGGVLATVHEITEKVLDKRRITGLRDLGARVGEARTPEEACRIAAQTLEAHSKDVPFALFYLLNGDRTHLRLAGATGVTPGLDISPETASAGDASDMHRVLNHALASGQLEVVAPLRDHFVNVPVGPWSDPPTTAVAMSIPSNEANEPAGVLVAGISARLTLDASYRDFLELVRTQAATAIDNALAYDEERKRANALAELDRAKTAFFSNVSHEFRTPLTLMLGPLEDALADRFRGSAVQREQLAIAHRNALRLLKLVNTLLDFSRLEAGRTQASYQPTDLAALTTELVSVFRAAIEREGLRLIVECPPLAQSVYVDREMWEKIVLNLLSNAFKFTFEGEIEVSLQQVGAKVELSVRDTGTGIAASDLPHIFERFHRIQGARGRTVEGSGIGLTLVQELVRLHGGRVDVTSELDRGTRFCVSVPLGSGHLPADRMGATSTTASTALDGNVYVAEASGWTQRWTDVAAPPPTTVDRISERQAPAGRERILLVDDNADLRIYVSRLLQQRYDVATFSDGHSALTAARSAAPDLVLADVMMPGLDGFQLLSEIRADERLKNVPVIMLSARAGEEARIEGVAAGADDYLVKPFAARELLARVESHLTLARMRRESQAALERSEARFRALTEASSDIVYRMSADWTEMQHLHGREFIADTLEPSQTWLERYIPSEGQPAVLAAITRAIDGKTTFKLEHRVIRTDGTLGWIYSRAIPILDARGEIVEWFGAASDVTARKHAEEARGASEERLRTIIEQLPAAVGVMDLTGTWVLTNSLMDLYVPRAIPSTLPDRHPRWRAWDDQGNPVPPERWPGKRALAGETVIPGLEMLYTHDDGRELWMRVSAAPLRNEAAEIVGATAVVWDITHVKEAEEALRRNAHTFATLVEQSPLGIYTVDSQFRVRHVSAGAMPVFRSVHPLIGRDFAEVIRIVWPEPFASEAIQIFRHTLDTGEPYVSAGFTERRGDVGTVESYEWQTNRVRLTDGEYGVVCYFFDSTRLREAEAALRESKEQLEQANRRKDEFLALLAHELRNPLAPIRTGLELIRLAGNTASSVERVRTTMERQVGHMVRLIDDLLDVSRITSGKITLQRKPVALADLVAGAIEANRPAFEAKGLELSVRLPDVGCVLDVDPTRMVQVLSNLLHNAAKFTSAGGHIDVSAQCSMPTEDGPKGDFELTISDDGMGISQEVLSHVFDLFVQGEQSGERSQPGLGIGLALVRRLVEMHGGEITATSKGIDQGSAFTIRLPITRNLAEADSPRADSPVQPVTCRVVVIDDNEDAARTMAMVIEELGGETRVASDGYAGLRAVSEFRPDVVLLDIGMPGMDGYETCRRIRIEPFGSDLRIVALTGWGQERDKKQALDAGFDAHLTKPADPAVLERILAAPRQTHVP